MTTTKKNGLACDVFTGTKRQDITLVWVHGTGGNKTLMEAVRPTLSEFSNVFFDLPGHGDSDGSDFSEESYIRAIVDVTDGLDNVVLIGHSLGAALTLEVLAKGLPNIIGGVILNGAVRFDQIDAAFYKKIHDRVLDLPYVLDGCGHADHPKVKKAIDAMEPEAVTLKDWCIDEKIDVSGALSNITVPVEILAGEADPFAPVAAAQTICDGIRRSHIITIPGGRHLSFLTDDDKLTECVDRVLIKAGKAQVDTSPILSELVGEVEKVFK